MHVAVFLGDLTGLNNTSGWGALQRRVLLASGPGLGVCGVGVVCVDVT